MGLLSKRGKDPNGKYEIRYRLKVPYLFGDVAKNRIATQKTRVTGKDAKNATVKALQDGGYKVISVRRTNWFS